MTAAIVPALEARGLVRDLGEEVKTRILHGIDLAIAPGEFVSVTGASGSGKSTLLYLLGALDRPTEGEVLIEGQPTAALDDRARGALRAERLGFVFQFHFLLPEFTSVENVAIPMLRRKDIAPAEAQRRAVAARAGEDWPRRIPRFLDARRAGVAAHAGGRSVFRPG